MTVTFFVTVFCFYGFSQDAIEEDSFDDMFDDSYDTDERIVTEVEDVTTSVKFLTIPLKMSGELGAEIGAAAIVKNESLGASGYFDLQNYLFFTTRPDKYIAIKGSLKTSMPDKDEADKDGQNHYFYLYELYFDYIMGGRVYITAGKKKTVWGNIRLFSNTDDFENDDDALYTNALYDSRYNISGIIRIPFAFTSITLLTMFRILDKDSAEPSYRDMSFAGCIESIFFNTSINVFARTFPSKYGNSREYYSLPILGAEVKRTILTVDLYAQGIARPISNKIVREGLDEELYHKSSFERFVFTGGFYRLWSNSYPYVGINAEFQSVYFPSDVYETKYDYTYENGIQSDEKEWINVVDSSGNRVLKHEKNTFENKLAVDFGLAKLGADGNIKIGVQWVHNITNKTGFVKPGIIISRIFPHCDWRIGVQYDYDKINDDKFGKLTLGSYLRISLDY